MSTSARRRRPAASAWSRPRTTAARCRRSPRRPRRRRRRRAGRARRDAQQRDAVGTGRLDRELGSQRKGRLHRRHVGQPAAGREDVHLQLHQIETRHRLGQRMPGLEMGTRPGERDVAIRAARQLDGGGTAQRDCGDQRVGDLAQALRRRAGTRAPRSVADHRARSTVRRGPNTRPFPPCRRARRGGCAAPRHRAPPAADRDARRAAPASPDRRAARGLPARR